jgi:hypothetical protein
MQIPDPIKPILGYEPAKNLSEIQIDELYTQRQGALEPLKIEVSRKMYYLIEEKLAAEKAELKKILDWQQGKNSELSKFSLVLDPHYFEQEFLN